MVATILLGANVFFFEARILLRHVRDVGFVESPERFTDMLIEILLRGAGSLLRQSNVRSSRTSKARDNRNAFVAPQQCGDRKH